MGTMFYQAVAFDGDLANWDVSKVKNVHGMFYNAEAFKRDLSKWDVSSV